MLLKLCRVAAAAVFSLGLPSLESGVCNLVHPSREAVELQRYHHVTQPQAWATSVVFMLFKMCRRVPHTLRSVDLGYLRARRGCLVSLQLAAS